MRPVKYLLHRHRPSGKAASRTGKPLRKFTAGYQLSILDELEIKQLLVKPLNFKDL